MMAETQKPEKPTDWMVGVGLTLHGLLDTVQSLRDRIGILEGKVYTIEKGK